MADTPIIEQTTAELLYDKLNSSERPVLIHALGKEAYIARRIPGSVNIPITHADWIKQVVPDKDQDIVVYCANRDCDASPDLARVLMGMGYTRVWDFEEGMAGWEGEGYELTGADVS